ncbi:glutamine amidotransferase [Orrella sp. JC864]|uniref:glutamine amidotransferase n=1 Tax=Orrella sp. JC864 TaxID=3120298 RepID=UPI0012BD6D6B
MSSAYRPVLILHTGDPHADILHTVGSYARMLRRTAALAERDAHIVPVFQGAWPGDPSDYSAALITGSPANVTDRDEWGERTARWLAQAASQGLPLFGICYGHQLLAHALGGAVDFNPAGRETGTGMLQVLAAGRGDPMLAGLPERFPVQLQHMQTITRLPPGAVSLARTELDGNQLVRMGERIVSTQFHPEFPEAVPRADLARRGPEYAAEGLDVAALQAGIRPTPEAATLVRRFLALYAPQVPLQQAAGT